MVGFIYLLIVAILVGVPELAMRWAWTEQPWFVTVGIMAASVGLNWWLWRATTRAATSMLARSELSVLSQLDARLSA